MIVKYLYIMEGDPIVLFNIFFAKKNEIQPDAGKSLIYRNSLKSKEQSESSKREHDAS